MRVYVTYYQFISVLTRDGSGLFELIFKCVLGGVYRDSYFAVPVYNVVLGPPAQWCEGFLVVH